MKMLAHFSAKHWKDDWLKTQFYLKGYDWFEHGDLEAGEAAFDKHREEYIKNVELLEHFKDEVTWLDDNTLVCL